MNNECCAKCRYYHRLKHNFKVGEGFEESYCCDALMHLSEGNTRAWVQEVTPQDRCEMYEEKDHIANADKMIEPTIKTCRTCGNHGSHHGICEICKNNKCWTEKDSTTKNDVPENNAENIYICSCGYGWDKSKVVRHHFCPNCGKAVASATKNDLAVDAVSRKDVHDMLENLPVTDNDKWFNWLQKACMRLAELPPVTPQEPKRGHWEHGRELSRVFIGDALRGINYEDWHCSNCHCVIEQSIKPKWNYCPNCGADMREVKE